MTKTWQRWEQEVADSLGLARVMRETYGELCPDVIQVDGAIPARPFWNAIQALRDVGLAKTGPLIGECKSRKHSLIPGYIIEALRASRSIEKEVPAWMRDFISQACGYELDKLPALPFVAIKKKPGAGKGNGSFRFVVFETDRFGLDSGVRWDDLTLMEFDEFVEKVKQCHN